MNRTVNILLLAAAIAFSAGCESDHKIAVADVDPLGWSVEEEVSASYLNEDTLALYDLSVLVRYRGNLSSERVSLLVETITPDSLSVTEPIVVRIEKPRDTRLSQCREVEEPYRTGVRLSRKGRYDFVFSLSSRENEESVGGICGVGMVLTPSE